MQTEYGANYMELFNRNRGEYFDLSIPKAELVRYEVQYLHVHGDADIENRMRSTRLRQTVGQGRDMCDRIMRIEALIEQLAKKVRNGNNGSMAGASFSALSEDGYPASRSSNGAELSRSLTAYEQVRSCKPAFRAGVDLL
ncbi:MAG: hypothetical protein Q9157_000375 [Trypethelium eluteriae]